MAVILKGATLFDGTGNNPLENATLIIGDDGRITRAGNSQEVTLPQGEYDIYNLEGKFILPGLIDCHVHMDLHGMANTYEENLVEDKLRCIRAAKEMENTLEAGFTTVRNVGSVNHIDFSVKEAVDKGLVKGPRILTSGKILSITCAGTEYFTGLYRVADGYEEFKKAAREQLKMGADLIKVMATGAVMNPGGVPGAEQPDVKELEAIVEEAGKLGKKVAAHAHGTRGIKNAIRAGVATIEHGTFADDEALCLMAENNVYLIPTLVVGDYMLKYGPEAGIPRFMIQKAKEGRSSRISLVRRALAAGVKVAMGTDAGTPYNFHGRNAAEIILYVKEGLMSAPEAIISATKVAAEACGLGAELGTLEEGKVADVLVVDGNPLKDIELLGDEDNIKMIFKAGQLVKNLMH